MATNTRSWVDCCPDEADIAWVAGIIDGEGHIRAAKAYRYIPPGLTINVAQKDPRLLRKLLKVTGMGKLYGPYSRKTASGKPSHIHYWTVNGWTGPRKLLVWVWPHLGEVKREQADKAREKAEEMRRAWFEGRAPWRGAPGAR